VVEDDRSSDAVGIRTADTRSGRDNPEVSRLSYDSSRRIEDSDIAVDVNGTPIFVSTVLERHQPKLAQAKKQLPPDQYEELREQFLKEDLNGHIEQALVINAVRKTIKGEKWDELEAKLDDVFWNEQIPTLQEKMNVETVPEVEAIMQASGTTMSSYRRTWGNEQIAMMYVREKLPPVDINYNQIRRAYEDRIADYTEPEQVRWQQCVITYSDVGGRSEADAYINDAVLDLRDRIPFDEIVRNYSDGPRLSQDGNWDWVQPDSLKNEQLRKALQSLRVDEVSSPIHDEQTVMLVKVTGRRPSRTIPFEEVQKELVESLRQEERSGAAKQLLDELRSKAQVRTIFDDLPASNGPPIRTAGAAGRR